jgi:hypothetical protein
VFLSDLFFTNKIVFLATYSRRICLTTVKWLDTRKITGVFAALREVCNAYRRRGFIFTTIHGDNEFVQLQSCLDEMAAKGDHVPEIERRIRVIKERCRALRHSLPFNKIPLIITMYMVSHAMRMLNFFPQKTGVSETMSPKTIVSGSRLDCKRHLALPFGHIAKSTNKMSWDVATSITKEHSVLFVLDRVTTNKVAIDLSCLCRLDERSRVPRGRNCRCRDKWSNESTP